MLSAFLAPCNQKGLWHMRLSELLAKSLIKMDLESTDKDELFEEMVSLMYRQGVISDREQAVSKLRERERKMSTGVAHWLAIPHGKLAGIDGVSVALGVSKRGIDYNALDHEPVHVVVMVFSEEGNPGPHIQALSEISRLFSSERFIREICDAQSSDEVLQLIMNEE